MEAFKGRMTAGGLMDFNRLPKDRLREQFNAAIDRALEENAELQEPRGYLGGSRLGLECHRQLAYEYFSARANRARWVAAVEAWGEAAVEAKQGATILPLRHRTLHHFPGKILRRFRAGHWCEDEVAALMRLAGFDLVTENQYGKQFGFYVAPDPDTGEARMAGHCDGRIESGPLAIPYPVLWENKITKSSKWQECVNRGVKAVYPIYYFQVQTYLAYFELHNALLTLYNSDTSEIAPELIPFNQKDAQWATDRGVAVLQAQSPEELPRITNDPAHYLCKWCNFSERCWAKPDAAPETAVAKPAWLTKEG